MIESVLKHRVEDENRVVVTLLHPSGELPDAEQQFPDTRHGIGPK